MADQYYWRRSQRRRGTFRLRITAEFAPHSAQRLRDMVWANRHIAIHNVITKHKWHLSDFRPALAFLATMTQGDGENLITNGHGAIMDDDDALAAEWSHTSLSALIRDSVAYQVPHTWPVLTFHQHPRFWVVRVSRGDVDLPRRQWPIAMHPPPTLASPDRAPAHHVGDATNDVFDISDSDVDDDRP